MTGARLRRAAVGVIALGVLIAAIAFAITRVTGGGGGYLVRAVFMNSSFVTPGEQVKVAGATVGTIHAVQLTSDNRAAVVLQITDRRFVPFRADAHCAIGLESLLGEQYVQCTPTGRRPAGAPAPRPLPRIRSGAGAGEHLLPVSGTTTPVGFDLLLDMNRLPLDERLRLLISGLGTGLDANGHELNLALRRADPALERTDQVIGVLARQNRTIARLTDASARVLAPLAAQRAHLGGFLRHGGAVAAASAQEGPAIQANLRDLPAFLRQLRPAADRLGRLADAATPSLTALRTHAPQINTAVTKLGPLAARATPALTTLGRVARRATTVFPQAHRVTSELLSLAAPLVPVADDLAATASSFDRAGGIEDAMRFIYYYTGAVNGENSLGHYVRTLLELSNCSPRSPYADSSCSANYSKLSVFETPAARRAASAGRSPAPATPDASTETARAATSRTSTPAPTAASASIVAAAMRAVATPRTLTDLKPLTGYLLGR
jgi:phospholipid/cholesterol/gamma-HCH transport system substrate-binding protein